MPIYEYRCDECGHGCELLQSMHDEHRACCQQCGSQMYQVYHAPAVQGDLPMTGANVIGYDETLGCHVRGRQHQQDLLKARGMKIYEKDPLLAKYGSEARYIEKHDPSPEGHKAARAVRAKAGQERRENAVKKVWDEAAKTGEF
jgi:putative FmdB family regulatory protein